MRAFVKTKRAFTLIEITIALLVLAIGLVGILTLFPVGFDASGRVAGITTATFLAQELIEDLKRCGYGIFEAPETEPEYATTGTTPNRTWTLSGIFDGFNYEYDIIAYENGVLGVPTIDLREVVARVYWPADAGEPGNRANQKFVEFSTYLAKY